jgi:hypothetical protein
MHRLDWLMVAMLVTGCDPFQQPGTWRAPGDNDANLRVMVVNPRDLVEGIGESTSAGAEAAPPVARLLAGQRHPLPNVNASTVGTTAEPQQQGAAIPAPAP